MTLAVENITFRVDNLELVSGVHAEYKGGQLTAILGANGAGKSTLLRCYAGLLAPSTGTVFIDGLNPQNMDPVELARKRAFLPQDHELSFPFSVLDVAMLGRAPHFGHTTRQADSRAVGTALRVCDLDHIRQQPYTTLSGGEKQRTHLARILAQVWTGGNLDARYMILDEPTNSLDIRHQQMLLRELVLLVKSGLCVIAVLHDINLAAQFADTIQLMKQGKVIASGNPDEVLTTGNLEEVFGIRSRRLMHPDNQTPIIVSRMAKGA
jgi:iron complex transport system ATP-binding protein